MSQKGLRTSIELLKSVGVFLSVLGAIRCGGNSTPTTPSPSAFSLSGQVTDTTTAAGISGATVSIADGPNMGRSATTDGSGSYGFTELQQAGFTANVTANGYVPQSKGVTLTSNQTLSFQLTRSTAVPNFQGQFTGMSVMSGCTETSLSGFCAGLGFNVSRTLSLALTVVQNQALATGTVTLGITNSIASSLGSSTMRGAFQGVIQSSGHLIGSAEVNTLNTPFCVLAPVDTGLPGGGGYAICSITATASGWDASVAGNILNGSFTLVFNGVFSGGGGMSETVGAANVSAALLGVTRQ